jgi:hypothetical protein
MADDTRRYVDSFVAALRQCGHSQTDLRRALLGHVVGDAAPPLPTPCVSGTLELFTAAQMTRYAQDYAAAAAQYGNCDYWCPASYAAVSEPKHRAGMPEAPVTDRSEAEESRLAADRYLMETKVERGDARALDEQIARLPNGGFCHD